MRGQQRGIVETASGGEQRCATTEIQTMMDILRMWISVANAMNSKRREHETIQKFQNKEAAAGGD